MADGGTTRDDGSDEITRADEEWPVAEQYRIKPPPEPPAEPAPRTEVARAPREEEAATILVQEPAAAAPRRPFPSPFDDARIVAVLLALALAIGLAVFAGWYVSRDDEATGTQTTPTQPTGGTDTTTTDGTTSTAPTTAPVPGVPDLTDATVEEARRVLAEAGLRVRVRRTESEEPAGRVLSQLPVAGAEVAENAIVTLTVSRGPSDPSGPSSIVVPNVIGETASAARRELEEAELVVVIERIASSRPNGTVIRQFPDAGEEVDEGTTVSLQVAKPRPAPQPAPEPTTVDVPRLVGLEVSDARTRVRELGLRSTVTRTESQRPEGTVIDQDPSPGTSVEKGSTVALTVSSGPAAVTVPDVVGLDEETARDQLEAAGFDVTVVDEPTADPAEDGVVVGQNPESGAELRPGSVVTIRVARLS